MKVNIFSFENIYPQAAESLLEADRLYDKCEHFFDELGAELELLQARLGVCRKEFQEKYNSTFQKANELETLEKLSLPRKEIQEIENRLFEFCIEFDRPFNLSEEVYNIEARLVDIAMEEQE